MSVEVELTPFEIGTVLALTALVDALKHNGSVNGENLKKLAMHFKENPPAGLSTPEQLSKYEWAFTPLLGDTVGVETVLGS